MRSPRTSISVDANSSAPKRSTCWVWRLRISMSWRRIRIATGLKTLRKIAVRDGDLDGHRGKEIGHSRGSRRQGGGRDDVTAVAQAVLHLRDAREEETVPMKHFAPLRREKAASQAFRPLLADELRLDAAVQCSNDDFDRLAIGVLAEEPSVHEGGVRNVQGVLRHGIERPRHFQPLADREVSRLIRARDLIRFRLGLDVGFGVHPHPTLRVAARKRRHAARGVVGVVAQTRHRLACTRAVELPPVVMALDVPSDDPPCGQRGVTVSAAIEQRDALSARVAKCNDW